MSEHSVRDHNRFDLQIKVIDVDPETGKVEDHVPPDPGRYEWQDRDGERVLYDRFDRVYFPHALVMEMLKRAMQMQPGPAFGVIPDIADYVESRRPLVRAALAGEAADAPLVDLSEAQLREFEKDELAFVIMSVDIKGSTKLAASTDRQTFARAINVLLTEIGELVASFHGHVLKHTGDGLIAYFRTADVHHQERRRARLRLLREATRLRRDQARARGDGPAADRRPAGSTPARRRSSCSARRRRSATPT